MTISTLIFPAILLLTMASGCYKPQHVQLPGGKPKFDVWVDGAGSDSAGTIYYLQDTNGRTYFINFQLVSGDPANYPITITYSGVPAGIRGFDSCTFLLNEQIYCHVVTQLPDGVYPFKMIVSTPDGTTVYPARVEVKYYK